MSEEQAQQLSAALNILDRRISDIEKNQERLKILIISLTNAIEAIKNLKGKDKTDVLMDIGGSVIVPAKISFERIILRVSPEVAIEKDAAATLKYLEMRMKEATVALTDNDTARRNTMAQLEQVHAQLGNIMQPKPDTIR